MIQRPADLDHLARSFAHVGLDVRTTILTDTDRDPTPDPAGGWEPSDGARLPDEIPDWIGLVAYRVVQEALTNAHRHGTGAASLVVSQDERELRIVVTNPVAEGQATDPTSGETAATTGAGLGLIGMRERVTPYGGELDVGPRAGGGWRVCATLPYERVTV
jgi:signal transduction histidine kinase